MSVTVRELTRTMALELAGNLSESDRAQILEDYKDLATWASERSSLPGMAWAIIVGSDVMIACGVAAEHGKGTLWLVGRPGWQRYTKHAIRIWRAVKEVRLYPAYRCECLADNIVAQRFAEWLGFVPERNHNDRVIYGMAL